MRRALVIAILLAFPAGASAEAPAKPASSVAVVSCATGPTVAERSATFTASMQAGEKTKRMSMRFDLYERRAGARSFRRVKAPNFGTWERSRRGVPAFIFTKRIEGLASPASYRVAVRFRWHGAGGKVTREIRRRSAICRQPDVRPDLLVDGLSVSNGPDADHLTYVVTVRNQGKGDAAIPFGVVLTVGQVAQPMQAVATLGAGGSTVLSFVAPRCGPGSRIAVVVDAADAIAEAREGNNRLTQMCPSGRA